MVNKCAQEKDDHLVWDSSWDLVIWVSSVLQVWSHGAEGTWLVEPDNSQTSYTGELYVMTSKYVFLLLKMESSISDSHNNPKANY